MLRLFRSTSRTSLGGQIMSILGIALVFTMLIFSLSVFYFVNRTETSAWQGRQSEAARNAAETVGGFIQRVQNALQVVGVLEPEHLVADSNDVKALLEANAALLEIVRMDSAGRILANAFRDKSILNNLITIPQSQWFKQARQGQVYLGDVQLSANNEPYLIMAVPSTDGGVVAARVEMDVLWDVVTHIQFGNFGEVIVVTNQGNIIAHTEPEFALAKQFIGDRPEFLAMINAPDYEWTGTYKDFHNETVVGATMPIPGTDWIVITELPQSEAFTASRNVISVLGFEGLFLLFSAGVVVERYVGASIVNPLKQLSDGVGRIGQGELDYRISLNRKDELGQLASTFNNMALDLEKQQSDLKKQKDEIASAYMQLAVELDERQKAQAALKTLNEELEGRIQTRTKQLTQINAALSAEIVERTYVEQQLSEAENKFRTLVEQIPAAFFIWEPGEDGACHYISPQIEKMLGFSVDEWLSDPKLWKRQLHPDDLARALADDANTLITGHAVSIEYRLMTRDGRAIWIRDEATPLPQEPGKPPLNFGLLTDITEQKQVDDKIRASLHEKEILLKEIHHRVKNNLQIISSLLNLQAGKVKDAHTIQALRESQLRVRSMALIHEKLYQSESMAKIDFGGYVKSLALDLFRSYQRGLGKVELKIEVDEVELELDQAVPCGLILNELMTNALKYAFPEGRSGTLRVELRVEAGQAVSLGVADDGVGMPPEFDLASAKTLGLQLVKSLVAQLDGRLDVDHTCGTAFKVSFEC